MTASFRSHTLCLLVSTLVLPTQLYSTEIGGFKTSEWFEIKVENQFKEIKPVQLIFEAGYFNDTMGNQGLSLSGTAGLIISIDKLTVMDEIKGNREYILNDYTGVKDYEEIVQNIYNSTTKSEILESLYAANIDSAIRKLWNRSRCDNDYTSADYAQKNFEDKDFEETRSFYLSCLSNGFSKSQGSNFTVTSTGEVSSSRTDDNHFDHKVVFLPLKPHLDYNIQLANFEQDYAKKNHLLSANVKAKITALVTVQALANYRFKGEKLATTESVGAISVTVLPVGYEYLKDERFGLEGHMANITLVEFTGQYSGSIDFGGRFKVGEVSFGRQELTAPDGQKPMINAFVRPIELSLAIGFDLGKFARLREEAQFGLMLAPNDMISAVKDDNRDGIPYYEGSLATKITFTNKAGLENIGGVGISVFHQLDIEKFWYDNLSNDQTTVITNLIKAGWQF